MLSIVCSAISTVMCGASFQLLLRHGLPAQTVHVGRCSSRHLSDAWHNAGWYGGLNAVLDQNRKQLS